MKKKTTWIRAGIFLILVILLDQLLDYVLIQPGLARTIFHESAQGGYDIVAVGASHGSYGIASQELGEELDGRAMNLCMGGEYMYDAYYVLCEALHHNKPKTVILDVDYQYLINQHDESILFNQIYNAYPATFDKFRYFVTKMSKEEYRGVLLRWTNYWQCYKDIKTTIAKKNSQAYKTYDSAVVNMNPYDIYKGDGFIYRKSEYKKVATEGLYWDESKVDANQCKYMKRIVNLCKRNNIQIIFTTVVQDPDSIAKYPEKFQAAHDYIEQLAAQYGVAYLDFNLLTYDRFARKTEDFYDKEGHMYGETAIQFTKVYGEVIGQSLDNTLNLQDYFAQTYKDLYGQS